MRMKCRNCGFVFEPSKRLYASWTCPECNINNTNLRLHYRSIVDFYSLGNIFLLFRFIVIYKKDGFASIDPVYILLFLLIAVTILMEHKSKTPWSDQLVGFLILIVPLFILFLFVFMPLLRNDSVNFVLLFLSTFMILYLYWLRRKTLGISVTDSCYEQKDG